MSEYPAAKPTIDLTDIRRAAVAAERARLRAAVEGLPEPSRYDVTQAYISGWVDARAAALALLEETP